MDDKLAAKKAELNRLIKQHYSREDRRIGVVNVFVDGKDVDPEDSYFPPYIAHAEDGCLKENIASWNNLYQVLLGRITKAQSIEWQIQAMKCAITNDPDKARELAASYGAEMAKEV